MYGVCNIGYKKNHDKKTKLSYYRPGKVLGAAGV
jgi:hypothetical protein